MISALATGEAPSKPIVVMDAEIGMQKNLAWLREHGYGYLVVSRKRRMDIRKSRRKG